MKTNNFKVFYFEQQYEVENQLMWLDTDIQEFKGWFHEDCIKKLENKSNNSLRISSHEMNIDNEIRSEGFCQCCFTCCFCEKILDKRLLKKV